jgi:dolichol-phosphate mannosyltransferase
MKKLNSVAVVIPVYQNSESLDNLVQRLRKVEENLILKSVRITPVFIDDGSTDNSLERLNEIKKRWSEVVVIAHTRNFGSVNAIKTGLDMVDSDAYVILAADLQDPPELIPQMVGGWLDGHKFVICEREDRKDPVVSKIMSKAFYYLIRTFIFPDFPKGGFDLMLFDKEIRNVVIRSGKSTYISMLLWWLGFKPLRINYTREKRLYGKSKWSVGKKLAACLDIFVNFSVIPLRLLILGGIIITFFSFSYSLIIFINALTQDIQVPGFATLSIILSFFMGSFFLAVGILGEYLCRVHMQLNGRPESVIASIG